MAESPPLLPWTLDQVVLRRPDRVVVARATRAERKRVTRPIEVDRTPLYQLDEWRIVAIRDLVAGTTNLYGLGWRAPTKGAMTAAIVGLSPDLARLQTVEATYTLGRPGRGDPGPMLNLRVALFLRRWGLDELYDLGVFPVPLALRD